MKRTILALFLFGLIAGAAAKKIPLDSAVDNILKQVLLFPQEKLYLQTDKPYYISGEKVFFRAFLLNAFSNAPTDMSRYVYVELINPADLVVIRQQIRPQENLFYGAIPLPEELPGGNYKLRAYTRFMENLGEDYFFSRYLRIADPPGSSVLTETEFDFDDAKKTGFSLRYLDARTKEPLRPERIELRLNSDKPISQKTDRDGWVRVKFNLSKDSPSRTVLAQLDYKQYHSRQYISIPYPEEQTSLSFYPEGGNLVAGIPCRVAFKALKSNGNAATVKGSVFDREGKEMTDFSTFHEGMGYFMLEPLSDEQYYVQIEGDTTRFPLPEIKEEAFSLTTTWRNEKLLISVNHSHGQALPPLYLVAHKGGMLIHAQAWDINNNILAIDKKLFPSGISHLLLLTENYQPVSERLIFNLNDDWATAQVETQKEKYKAREHIQATIHLQDNQSQPIKGSFAISVTDDKEILPDTSSNILSHILLSSELRGRIDNPAFYFKKEHIQAADLLMMTHGWNRYDIPKAMRGEYDFLRIPNEESQSLAGTVKGGLLSKPYEGGKVMITSTMTGFWDVTETDREGRFSFQAFEFPDSTEYVVQALTKKGKDVVELYLDSIHYPASTPQWLYPEKREVESLEPEYLSYITKAELKYTYENGRRTVHLPEVSVRGYNNRSKHKSPYYSIPDDSMDEKEIKRSASGDVLNLLKRLNDIKINEYDPPTIQLRGTGGFSRLIQKYPYFSGPPLIVVDGKKMTISGDAPELHLEALSILRGLDIDNISQIDIVRTPSKTTVYGSDGQNGVIEIYTKRGWISSRPKFNIARTIPLGYSLPLEFYSPKYETKEAIENTTPDLRSTIYWKPDGTLEPDGKTIIDFYSADVPASYSILLEGVNEYGMLIYYHRKSAIIVE